MNRLMVNTAPFRKPLPACASLALIFALPGCAAASGDYPSLAIRDAERPRGTIEAPEPPVPAIPVPPRITSADVLERAASLRSDAVAAHQRFLAAAPAARRAVSAGAGAAPASDAWARAQVALADLETHRSLTAVPLADLDALLVDQAARLDPVAEVARAHRDVLALVAEEDRTLAQLRSRIR